MGPAQPPSVNNIKNSSAIGPQGMRNGPSLAVGDAKQSNKLNSRSLGTSLNTSAANF